MAQQCNLNQQGHLQPRASLTTPMCPYFVVLFLPIRSAFPLGHDRLCLETGVEAAEAEDGE